MLVGEYQAMSRIWSSCVSGSVMSRAGRACTTWPSPAVRIRLTTIESVPVSLRTTATSREPSRETRKSLTFAPLTPGTSRTCISPLRR